ncbi:MAG: methyltransferase domain-containing protein, partial [Pirellulales bacterium]|nr:methyltransferase domain-containing protein [Pirellulales bacterium]
ANANARKWGLQDRVRFEVADATAYPSEPAAFDLVTCNDAAHHLPDLTMVGSLLKEMDRLCDSGGLVLLTDLVRLKSESLTDRYTSLIGRDYIEAGLHHFQKDFCNSMRAAWTGQELRSVVPAGTERRWLHRVQKLMPTVQFVAAYPNDGQPAKIHGGVPWKADQHPVPPDLQADWRLFRRLL